MVETTKEAPKPKVNRKDVMKGEEDLTKKYRRKDVEDLLKRKFFVAPSFEIYGGVAGFFDFGPLGCAVKLNVEQLWRQHFVLEEDMLEIGATCLTYSEVLKTSGHVDKFEDLMVKDVKTGTPRRADKLIIEWISKVMPKKKKPEEKAELQKLEIDVETYSKEQIDECIKKFGIKDPETGNDLGPAEPFNLMFGTMIGPTGQMKGYLRPETAQGIFINFRRLLEYNNGKMPFASAQIGLGFRNEIAPRQGLLRVREFTMAEIEHFCDPNDKSHPKFVNVASQQMPLLSA